MSEGIQKVSFDLAGFLKSLTGDESWAETNGPDSGMGLDYWYRNDDGEVAYINIDQFEMTITKLTYDGDELMDEETIYEGSAEEAQVA